MTDISVGDDIPQWVMEEVSAERMRTMAAILRDPNPVHWDRKSVAALGFGERTINQGPLGLSYMINMLQAWAGPNSIRRIFMTFPQVVLDGEKVIAKGQVTALREEADTCLVDCDIWLEHAERGRLLEGKATVAVTNR